MGPACHLCPKESREYPRSHVPLLTEGQASCHCHGNPGHSRSSSPKHPPPLPLCLDLQFWKENPKTSLHLFTAGSTDLQHPTDHQVLPRLRPPGKASLGPRWCRPAFRGLSLNPQAPLSLTKSQKTSNEPLSEGQSAAGFGTFFPSKPQ